jgi:hypothetical protein
VIDPNLWFPPLDRLYAARGAVDQKRVLFQGDVFDDVPCYRYPDGGKEDLVAPRGGRGKIMVLGHPCEISSGEKGDVSPWRLVCPVAEDRARRIPLDGEGHWYAFPLPDLVEREDVWYADFRFLSTVHSENLVLAKRTASLSEVGWIAVQRRLAHFLTRVAIHWLDLADAGVALHPDAGAA